MDGEIGSYDMMRFPFFSVTGLRNAAELNSPGRRRMQGGMGET